MAFTLAGSNLPTVEAFVGALYGYSIGSSTMNQVNSDITTYGSLNNALNAYYSAGFGSMTTSAVAAMVVSNVGLGTDKGAISYVTGVLNAAAPSARGAAISNVLNAFATLTSDATYGAAATAWTATVQNAIVFAANSTSDATLASAAATVAAVNAAAAAAALVGKTYTLTTAVDTFTGTAGNDTFTAADGTFTPLDVLTGNGGNDTINITNTTSAFSTPTGASTSGIASINLTSTKGVTFDTSTGYSGLTNLTVSASSPAATVTVTAAATTNQTVTVSTPATNQVTVYGGLNNVVTVNDSAANTDPVVVGSSTKGAAGTVTVNLSQLNTTGGAVTVVGGTAITVNSTMTNATTGTTNTIGAISVTGTSITKSVAVNESTPVALVAAAPAVTGQASLVSATAAIGVNTVTITDLNNTSSTTAPSIASVSLSNFGTTTINSSALNTLTLSSSGTGSTGSAIAAGAITINATLTKPTSAGTLTVNANGGTYGGITDTNGLYNTLNVVGSASSTLGSSTSGIVGSAITALNISGTGTITTGALPATVTAITLSGAGGISATLPTLVTSITGSNTTGAITATLANASQSVIGGAGALSVSTAYDPTVAITGGKGANTLVLTSSTAAYTASNAGANITGFTVLDSKPADNSTVSYNLTSTFAGNKFTSLIAEGSRTSTTFTNVTAGTPLTIKSYYSSSAYDTRSGTVVYNTSDFNGSSDSVTVTLTGASAGTVVGTTITKQGTGTQGTTTNSLTLADGAGNGIGTVNIVTDGTVAGSVSTIATLVDSFLSTLNISGTSNLAIGAFTGAFPTLTIVDNDTSTGTSSGITTFTNPATFSSLSYSGSQAFSIGSFGVTDTATTISLTNANTGTNGVLTIGGLTLSAAKTINLNGSIAATITDTSTGGVVISGGTDNQKVAITLTGALAGKTDTITLGNGGATTAAAQTVSDNSVAGTVNITVGTGYNTIAVPTVANATSVTSGIYNITVGTHISTGTNYDNFYVGTAGSYVTVQPNYIITGATTNDVLNIVTSTATTVTTITAGPSLATTISALQASHSTFNVSVYGGNTYVYADLGSTSASGATFVELIGSHTFTAASGIYTIAS